MAVDPGAATVLERVRVHGGGIDAQTARLRLEHRLAGADLRPPGMPASAVLCVRELVDPLPGGLGVDEPGGTAARAWEDACRARLARLLRSAARPAHEPVPAGAQAVLFSDQSELLACLARDAMAGVAWRQWWWRRQRARAGPGRDPMIEAWLEAPAHAPAALALLTARGEAVSFVGRLSETQARSLTGRIAAAFGASSLQAVLAGSRPAPRAPGRLALAGPGGVVPPWRELVPETRSAAAAAIGPEGELLLGVALALRRAPSRARAGSFAAGVAAWLKPPAAGAAAPLSRAAAGAPDVVLAPTSEVGFDRSSGAAAEAAQAAGPRAVEPAAAGLAVPGLNHRSPPPAPDSVGRGAAGPERGWAVPPGPAADAHEPPLPARARARARAREATAPPAGAGRGPADASQAERPAPLSATPGARRSADPGRHAAPRAAPVPRLGASAGRANAIEADRVGLVPPAVVATDTALGGVFYLLNLLIALGMYGDFTTPRQPGIELDPWDCVTLLARRLIGRPVPVDPVWGLLARLAGRDLGAGFRPPRSWRVPAEWLEPFPSAGRWRWSAAGGTLRIIHPAGFPAIAVPRTGAAPAEQLRREWSRLPLPAAIDPPRRAALAPEPRRPLERWVSRLAAYAEARLRLALGAGAEPSLTELLFAHRARVVLTPTHVEITLRLAGLPLAVRFAGLDRTPGWLPAAGRFVSIEFE